MNVLLINGSPHKNGCTNAALTEMAKVLNEAGIETTIFHIGSAPVGRAVWAAAAAARRANACSAALWPTCCRWSRRLTASCSAHRSTTPRRRRMLGFMHRLAISGGKYLRHKPAAVVTSARRAGTTTALEAMEKVPQFFEMPLISSTYWPMVHGGKAEEVLSDEEGLQIMRNLGRNMAWMLRCIEAGKAAGIAAPVAENDKRTNFIR